uniref:TRAP transporter small permease n=1 Tax=Herbaspirillum lusitanum TaxID=213312 RepID=UPI0003658518
MKTMTAPLAPVDAAEAENVIHSLHASPNDAVDYPRLQRLLELASAAVLAVDVLVVFFSVIWRYALHDPLEWSEEVARALMITLVFFGAASVLGRSRHVGIDSLRGIFPKSWLPYVLRLCDWVIAFVSLSLAYTTWLLLEISNDQTTPSGLPQTIFVLPVLIGSLLLSVFAITHALKKFGRNALVSGLIGAVVVGGVLALQTFWPDHALRPMHVLLFGFRLLVAVARLR